MHLYSDRNLVTPVIILIASVSLAGCAGSPAHTIFIAPGEIEATLDGWLGKDVSEAIDRYGPPTKVSELSGKEYYEWREEGDSTCRWWFRLNDDNKIDDSGSSGNTYHCFVSMDTD